LGLPVGALVGKDILEPGGSYYRLDVEEKIKTYKDEAHQDEKKGDSVRRFSHRGELSQVFVWYYLAASSNPFCPRSSYIQL
jgi:hypothetical protein